MPLPGCSFGRLSRQLPSPITQPTAVEMHAEVPARLGSPQAGEHDPSWAAAVAAAGALAGLGYYLAVTGKATVDTGWGGRVRPLRRFGVQIAAPAVRDKRLEVRSEVFASRARKADDRLESSHGFADGLLLLHRSPYGVLFLGGGPAAVGLMQRAQELGLELISVQSADERSDETERPAS